MIIYCQECGHATVNPRGLFVVCDQCATRLLPQMITHCQECGHATAKFPENALEVSDES